MEPPGGETRRQARTVEIMLAVALGTAVFVAPAAGFWRVRWALGLTGPGWDVAASAVVRGAAALGLLMTVWWLVRARDRGL
ncbi:hypothetical protein [Pseudonocardia asaccharolytica]|nr:hypothetical protein [Pseudonocardia asaccharolytica]